MRATQTLPAAASGCESRGAGATRALARPTSTARTSATAPAADSPGPPPATGMIHWLPADAQRCRIRLLSLSLRQSLRLSQTLRRDLRQDLHQSLSRQAYFRSSRWRSMERRGICTWCTRPGPMLRRAVTCYPTTITIECTSRRSMLLTRLVTSGLICLEAASSMM